MRFVIHSRRRMVRGQPTDETEYELRDGRINDAPYAVFDDILTADEWASYLNAAYPHGTEFSHRDMTALLTNNPKPPTIVIRNATTGENLHAPERPFVRAKFRRQLERLLDGAFEAAAKGNAPTGDEAASLILNMIQQEVQRGAV